MKCVLLNLSGTAVTMRAGHRSPVWGHPPIVDIIPNSFCIFNKNFDSKKHERLATNSHEFTLNLFNHRFHRFTQILFTAESAQDAEGFSQLGVLDTAHAPNVVCALEPASRPPGSRTASLILSEPADIKKNRGAAPKCRFYAGTEN